MRIYCWIALGLYAFLSVADFRLTSALLRANGEAYESNPVAAACLEQHGWHGLAIYKTAGVLAFAGAVFLLVRRRPQVGAGIVTLGCLVLLTVTTYSQGLLADTHREYEEWGLTPEQIETMNDPQGPRTMNPLRRWG